MTLPTKSLADIRALDPCYDPARYLPEGWTGTALDVLRVAECPAQDRLWVVLHEGWIDDRRLRLFAVWCARQALARVDDPDPRSVAAIDVAERRANGEATDEQLAAASAAAQAAAWAAASAAARSAAGAAAWDVARSAAGAAAWDVVWAATRAARAAADYEQQVAALIDLLLPSAQETASQGD